MQSEWLRWLMLYELHCMHAGVIKCVKAPAGTNLTTEGA
jgi:hypothetical protein